MLTGAVLAGGKSVRYGKNKALEAFRGRRLIDIAVESLRSVCDPVLVVANDLGVFMDLDAMLVRDFIPEQGPLGGIYTALLASPNEWVFTRATDMPFFVPELVALMDAAKDRHDAVVPIQGGRFEPLFALYRRRCIPVIADLLMANERKVSTLYRKIRLRRIEEPEWRAVDPEGLSFRNVNTPGDMEGLLGPA